MSTRLPGSRWPSAMSWSMASEPSATASKASPAATRRAASTPPTDSSATATPGCWRWWLSTSSVSSFLVAMEEMRASGAVGMVMNSGSIAKNGCSALWTGASSYENKSKVQLRAPPYCAGGPACGGGPAMAYT